MPTASELTINTAATADDMANAIFGDGVTVVSATYEGAAGASGVYSGGIATLGELSQSDTGLILSTGNATDFTNSSGTTDTNTAAGTSTNHTGAGEVDGDAQLDAVSGQATQDGAFLNASFIPTGDLLTMQFVFTSEEYLEYVNGGVNDAIGVFVNGVYVPLTLADGTDTNVTIDTINDNSNSNLYVDNPAADDTYNTEMDGGTVVLSLTTPVNPLAVNTIRIGIADGGDSAYDSNLLVMGNSVQSVSIAESDELVQGPGATQVHDLLSNDINTTGSPLTITHINNVAVVPGDTVTLPSGEQITLLADGTVSVLTDSDIGTNSFTYSTVDSNGAPATGIGSIETTSTPPNYIVEGTAGDDLIDVNYTGDPQGDQVDATDNVRADNDDSIVAGAGDDTILAGEGDDTVIAGDGDDLIVDSEGDDSVEGGAGRDTFEYTTLTGNDTVVGGEVNDTSATNSGDKLDFHDNTDGINVVFGGDESGTATDGTDTVTFSEIEHILGGQGSDTIDASASTVQQILDGGEGADTIQGGSGDDLIAMGQTQDFSATDGDDDTLVLVDGFGNDSVEGFETPTDLGGGNFEGNDQVDVTGLTDASGDPVNTDDVLVTDTNGDGTGDAILIFPNGETLTLFGVDAADVTSAAQLGAIGIPLPPNFIVEGTGAGEQIDIGYSGDPEGDRIDNSDHSDGSNDDSVQAGGGNDTVVSGEGNDSVDAGDGDDIVYAGNGDDSVTGGQGADEIYGEAGNDTLQGGAGNDTLDGGTGEDLIQGGADDDSILGFDDDDTLEGGDGADFINGGYGDDLIDGGDGNDFLEGWYGNDTINAGAGDDFVDADIDEDLVFGGDGNDTILGGFSVSSDTLHGDAGNDSIDGQSGDDLLYGGTGDDVLLGNFGDDTIFLEDDFGADTITGGEGDETNGDTLDLSAVTTGTTVDLSNANPETGSVSNGTDTAQFTEIENIVLGGGRDTVELGDGGGNDAVQAFDMADSGDGTTNDQLDVTDLTSDGGTTPVHTGDVVVTDTNGDGTGDAILTFPGGESITLVGVAPTQVDTPAELESIGIPAAPPPNFIVEGGAGNDLIDASFADDPQGDMIDNSDHSDGSNDDSVQAGAGDDTVLAGLGDDTVDAGDGADEVHGGAGNDNLSGGAQDDTLFGGEDDDTIAGGSGNDSIEGGAGEDSILGGTGNDAILGGDGDDTIVLEDNFGNDTIDGSAGGETDGDTLDLSAITTDTTVDLTSANPEDGSVSDGTSTASFVDIENIVLGGGRDTIELADGGGNDAVQAFDMADSGDGTTNDQLDVSGLTSDGGTTPVTTADVVVTDTNGDGTGDAILTFPGGESITLVGVTPDQVDTRAELESIGIPAAGPNFIVEGGAGDDSIDASYIGDPEGDMVDANDHSDGSNDDSIQAGAGNDTVLAGLGDDTVAGEDGDDSIDGGAGADSIDGGSGADYITGGAGADTILGGDGNDTLDGGLNGGNFDDQISGGDGDDLIDGGDGADTLQGDAGDDTIIAGSGDDSVTGGTGSDFVTLDSGNDTVQAGDDADYILANAANYADGTVVSVDGGTGGTDSDTLDLSDFDAFRGLTEAQDADLDSTSGSVEVQNANGDWITFTFTEIEDLILPATDLSPDFIVEGTAGADTIDASYTGDPEGDMIDANDHSDGSNDDLVQAGDGADSVIAGAGDDTVFGQGGDDTILGGDGNDALDGDGGSDSIDGGAGDDTLIGDAGDDTLAGGAGNDEIYVSTGSNEITGDAGNDQIFGGDGDDDISGGDDDDTISGGTGDDTLTGDAGDDSVAGGDGDDVFTLDDGFGNDTIVGGEAGETDGDTLDLKGTTTGVTVDLTDANPEDGTVSDGTDTAAFSEIENIILGAGRDTVALADGGGDDTVQAFDMTDSGDGTTNDQLDVSGLTSDGGTTPVNTGNVVVTDTNGDGTGDAILTFPGGESITLIGVTPDLVDTPEELEAIGIPSPGLDYIVEGTAGNDMIDSSYSGDPEGDMVDNNDALDGSNDDVIIAGEGDDSVLAGAGDDTASGGEGNDTIEGGAGNDELSGGAGNDTLAGGDDNDTLVGNDGDDSLLGDAGDDSLSGNAGADTIEGGVGQDSLFGGAGEDSISGGDGDDFVSAGIGNDSVDGGAGNDSLAGADGDDTLIGGAGDDLFSAGNDNDLLYGDAGSDTMFGSVGNDTIFGGDDNDSVVAGADDDVVQGDAGDDTLRGGEGDDSVDGGDGDDRIVLEDNFGNDTIIGGETGETNGDTLDLSAVTTGTTVDLTSFDPEAGSVGDGTSTATFIEIENIILGGGRDTVELGDGGGDDAVDAFDMTDSGDGTTNDQLDVSDLTSDGGTTPVTTADVIVTDTNGDGTGDAILTFPGGESITLVGVLPEAVDSEAELQSIGIPGTGVVDGTSGDDIMQVGYVDTEGDIIDGADGLNDTIFGYDGNDSIDGGLGADDIDGGDDDDTIDAGDGDDTITGGSGDDTFVISDGDDTITDFNAGNTGTLDDGDSTNNDFVDLSGHYDHLSELYADQADDGILNQSNATDTRGNAVDYSDNTGFGGGSLTLDGATADGSSLTAENTGVVCFTTGTAIRTPLGDVLIEDLKIGDLVMTLDNGPQKIRWIGTRHIERAELQASVNLRPVLIKQGVLGATRDLLVSRQHGMLVGRDHLVRAVHLADATPGVRIAHGKRSVTYVHLMFDAHQVIFAENTQSESFFPGPMAMGALATPARTEMLNLYPELADIQAITRNENPYGLVAREFLGRKKLERALKHDTSLVSNLL